MSKVFESWLKPEDIVHIQVGNYAAIQYPGVIIHHSPNEGKRGKFQAWLIKKLRVSPGFPDLILVWQHKIIFLEVKAIYTGVKNGRLVVTGKGTASTAQSFWISLLRSCGLPAKVCTGYDECVAFIDYHFKPIKDGSR